MKRKNIIISSALAACILSSSAVVLANTTDTAPPWMNQANKYIDRMIQDKKDRLRDKTQAAVAAEVEDVYNYALKKAKTKEQIDAILALQNDKSNGIGEWKRKTLQVIGELPMDAERLTLKDAQEIVKSSNKEDPAAIVSAFNEKAGAPDWEGGSGIHYIAYYLNDNQSESITIANGEILHQVGEKENKRVTLINGDMTTPLPTSSPATKK